MVRYDVIGYWSEIKLDIIKEYARAYSQILSAQGLYHIYVDAFAGAGKHVSRTTGLSVDGSPSNALSVQPPFREYHFIDFNPEKVQSLREIAGERPEVHLYEGDCNTLLLEKVFPRAKWKDYHRALVLLDPYGLHLDWKIIQTAGRMRSVEIFLNFPVVDMNRNVLWRYPEKVDQRDLDRMNAFWGGDQTWREVAYETQQRLFGPMEMKNSNDAIAQGFRKRLEEVAGFKHVPEPIPMRNTQGSIIYYLFFASQKPVAGDIVKDIFDKYRHRGEC